MLGSNERVVASGHEVPPGVAVIRLQVAHLTIDHCRHASRVGRDRDLAKAQKRVLVPQQAGRIWWHRAGIDLHHCLTRWALMFWLPRRNVRPTREREAL